MAEGVVEQPPKRIMVCIDDSENSKSALDYYIENLHCPENEVIVLHVSDGAEVPMYLYAGGVFTGGVGVVPETTSVIEKIRKRNKEIEDKYNAKCQEFNVKNKVLIVSRGHGPGWAIVDTAQKHNVNMIVVGSRGLGKIRRTILGLSHIHRPSEMSLYYYYDLMSQPCRAVYIFLKAANIPFESKLIAIRKGEQRQPEYLALNPLGKVPIINDNGFQLTESVAILKYLSDQYSHDDSWYPKDLQKRARVDEYCAWQHLNTRAKAAKVFIYEVLMNRSSDDVTPLVNEMETMLDEFEKVFLKDKKFITGDTVTVADLLAACEILQVTISGRDPLAGRPVIGSWMERVRSATNPYFDEAHAILYTARKRRMKHKL